MKVKLTRGPARFGFMIRIEVTIGNILVLDRVCNVTDQEPLHTFTLEAE